MAIMSMNKKKINQTLSFFPFLASSLAIWSSLSMETSIYKEEINVPIMQYLFGVLLQFVALCLELKHLKKGKAKRCMECEWGTMYTALSFWLTRFFFFENSEPIFRCFDLHLETNKFFLLRWRHLQNFFIKKAFKKSHSISFSRWIAEVCARPPLSLHRQHYIIPSEITLPQTQFTNTHLLPLSFSIFSFICSLIAALALPLFLQLNWVMKGAEKKSIGQRLKSRFQL